MSEPERLTKFEREALEHEAHLLEEDSNELARKAQRIRRRLALALPYSGRPVRALSPQKESGN
jgi:hypothetical protein